MSKDQQYSDPNYPQQGGYTAGQAQPPPYSQYGGQPGYTGPGYTDQPGYAAQPQPSYAGQPAYVVQQPGYGGQTYVGQPAVVATTVIVGATPPNDYLAFSIVTMICFNLIFGLIALICSLQSREDANRGDMTEAQNKSRCALGWNIAGIVSCAVFVITIIIIVAQ